MVSGTILPIFLECNRVEIETKRSDLLTSFLELIS